MANLVFIATSIDGYIANKDDDVSWLELVSNPEKSDFGFSAFTERIDAIVMGRRTFEKVLSFDLWPYTKKVFVLSSSLKVLPNGLDGKAEIVFAEPKDLIRRLSKLGFNDLYIDGGITIRSFLKEDLIDELIISTIPIILGDGISLFGKQDRDIKLEHVETQAFNGGLVQSRYKRVL